MPTLKPLPISGLPITRRRDGSPMTETVRLVNRSDLIRWIFQRRGKSTPNPAVHNELILNGFTVSDALINGLRKKMP